MKKSHDEILQTSGRQFAGDILSQTVRTAKNANQLNNQLQVIDYMAVHIIATNIYNRVKNSNENKTHLIMEAKELIENELETLEAHSEEMDIIKPDSHEEKK